MSNTPNIPDVVNQLADTLKAEMNLGDNGVIEVTKDAFEKTLPEGLTMETYIESHNHRDNVLAAMGKVTGEIGVEAMKTDKDLKQVTASMAIHKDTMASTFQRERQIPNAEGGTSTSYGLLRSNYMANGAANKGSLKKVKAHLSALGREAFAG